MKKLSHIILPIAIILFLSFNSSFKNETPIGTIIYSIMPPEYFQTNNPDWILLDGRNLESNSKLAQALLGTTLKLDSLPDARGMFLRGANYNGGIDIDSIRGIGTLQKDATKLPNKSFKSIGWASDSLSSHSHNLEKRETSARLSKYRPGGNSKLLQAKDNIAVLTPSYLEKKKQYFSTPSINHGHFVKSTINSGGDLETRPHNLNFFIYIKVK